MPLPLEKIFSPKVFRDIDEPKICGNSAVFIQNSCNSCKITISNIKTGKAKSVTMKGIICFNAHTDNSNMAYEFSGRKRGIGILYVSKLEIRELEMPDTDFVLVGIWGSLLIIKRGSEIVLYNIDKNSERLITSCHQILGTPASGGGNCAWLEIYKEKCFITIYNIEKGYRLTFAPIGHVNRIYVFQDYIAFQSCIRDRCCVFTYSIRNGKYTKCFESHNWIDLYMGRDNMLAWTVKKFEQKQYVFDLYVYEIRNERMIKILHDYKSALIPAVSDNEVIWSESGADGDNLYRSCMNLQ